MKLRTALMLPYAYYLTAFYWVVARVAPEWHQRQCDAIAVKYSLPRQRHY